MKTIALFDLFTGGHRDAFMRLFAEACLQNDVKVICIYPESDEIKHWFTKNGNRNLDNIIFINHKPQLKRLKKFGRFNDSINTLYYWRYCNNLLKSIEVQYQLKIDLVFFNWLDSQMANYIPPTLLYFIFAYKWSGLYFHPVIFRIKPEYLNNKATFRDIDSIYLSKNCVAVTSHDEGIIEKYQKRIGKSVILFPEIADATPPNTEHVLAKNIKTNANGRIVVGIIGLEPYKGAIALIRLVEQADASRFYFAFTGIFKDEFISKLPDTVQNEYKFFIQNLPENCLWQTGSLQEGSDYNSVFCSFDIVYIMYKNFYSSSNRLTKASIFNKLVLGNNYGCIGDDIPTYNLGETANEDDIYEQNQKIELLRNKILAKDFPYEQWEIYAAKHSTERLKEKFEELLNLV